MKLGNVICIYPALAIGWMLTVYVLRLLTFQFNTASEEKILAAVMVRLDVVVVNAVGNAEVTDSVWLVKVDW